VDLSRFGRRGEEKIVDPTGTRTPTPRSSSPYPVAIGLGVNLLKTQISLWPIVTKFITQQLSRYIASSGKYTVYPKYIEYKL
jgi:hypothetical protein